LKPNPVHRRAAHRQPQPLALRAATVQYFRAGVYGAKLYRLGCVEIELIFTLTELVIVLNFNERRFEASTQEAYELVYVSLPKGVSRGLNFVKVKRKKWNLERIVQKSTVSVHLD
jgi:hypothetical protein